MNSILSKTTYHAVYDESIMDALRYARNNGFAGVQLAIEVPQLSPERLTTAQRDAIGRYREEYNLTISLHAPDDTCSLLETSRTLTTGVFEYYRELFEFAEDVGAQIVVLHVGHLPTFPTDTQPEVEYPLEALASWQDALGGNLRRLINLAAGRFVLAVENFRLTRPLLDVLSPLLGDAGLSLCWDLAKTYRRVSGKASSWELDPAVESFFWKNLRHVRQVHLHDLRGDRSHRVIGTGELDFARFLSRLAEARVMEYCIEVRPREKASESLEALKRIVSQLE